ncbi:MAG: hypothetical protein JWO79_3521, partial [Actinomycetia bacterium]|nr:hypothetical protein [Actinomycetes bacterium]
SIYVLTETGGSWLVSQIQSKGECG